MLTTLCQRLNLKQSTIGIIGLGYVGVPLALRFAEVGYKVLGLDIDIDKVRSLNSGQSYIEHISEKSIQNANAAGFESSTDFTRAAEADALIVCVPTPLNRYREPDLSYVTGAVDLILPHMRSGQILSLESTTYPGTTDELLLPRIQSRGFVVGHDYFLVYSPEREDPGNQNFKTRTIPKVCGGHSSQCLTAGLALYEQVIDQVVPVSSTRAAELTKLLENIHRAVNIGLVNEMKIVADKMGIDIHEVIRAAGTKPFGFVPYYPGPGLGGHCIPIDPFYLTWKAREYGVHTRFIELAGEVNSGMPDYVIGKVIDALNQSRRSVSGSKVLVLGVAYKKNVDDMRESPSLVLMRKLLELGASVDYSDPHVPTLHPGHEHAFEMRSVTLNPDKIAIYDLVLLATDHMKFDYAMIAQFAKMIVDTRGVYLQPLPNVVKA